MFPNDGGNRKIVFTFNISGQNTSVVNCSDIARFAPPRPQFKLRFFHIHMN